MFSMDRDKSPGPDGFSMLFYQVCWDIVKSDLKKVFAKFFERGVISKGMNQLSLFLFQRRWRLRISLLRL